MLNPTPIIYYYNSIYSVPTQGKRQKVNTPRPQKYLQKVVILDDRKYLHSRIQRIETFSLYQERKSVSFFFIEENTSGEL